MPNGVKALALSPCLAMACGIFVGLGEGGGCCQMATGVVEVDA